MEIGLAMLENIWNQVPIQYTKEEIQQARAVLVGLFPTLERTYAKLKSGSPQRTLLDRRIKSMERAVQAIDDFFK